MYLLDTNVLVDANRDYYPINRVPEFWDWLIQQGNLNMVKIPREIADEVLNGNPDELTNWLRSPDVTTALLLQEEVTADEVSRVIINGYSDDLNDIEIMGLGRDPFLIAYALKDVERCVVTTERSKPSATRHNRHVPDVCDTLGVPSGDTFMLTTTLNFSTNWNNHHI